MDPIRAFLDSLQADFAGRLPNDVLSNIETMTMELFAKFELVPKHEYVAHLEILKTLEAQVAALEQRLQILEEPA